MSKITIERVDLSNYYKYEDMVYWRTHGVERTRPESDSSTYLVSDYVKSQIEHPGFYVYVAKADDGFIGWIHFMYTPKIGKWKGGVLYIDELWVAPEYRRTGVATKLMKLATELKCKTGASVVRLGTSNPHAQKLYEKSGLQATGYTVFMESN